MDSDAERNPDELAYWRRRVVALGCVLGTVALIAWACTSGGGQVPQQIRNAGALISPTPTVSGSGALPSAIPTVTVTATTKVTVTPTVPKRDGDACESKDLVVAFSATKEDYPGREWPQFRLSVVNLGEKSCTFDVGPKLLQLRITSGTDRVWSSAHCAQGSGSSIQMLRRGIPYLATLSWDRKRSTDGCKGGRATAGAGTYVAALKADGIKQPKKQVFRLR